jgi:hypothetical protein
VGGDAGDAGPALACPPASLGSWKASPYHHASAAQPAACTTALIADFYASCLGPSASTTACNPTWGTGEDTAHQTCQGCLVTPESAATWGALVSFGSTVSLNVAGCIELLDPGAPGVTCATFVQQADECEHRACDATCPVTDDASFANWRACVSAAGTSVCAAYAGPAGCAQSQHDAGPALRCVNGATFEEQYAAIAAVFCGP